jgi:V/A-type H+-transporting ATPase subunit K
MTWAQGLSIFAAALPMAIVGYFSAIYQGRVAASGVSLIAKKPTELVKGMTMSALVETYAVLALLVSFIAVNNITIG